MSREDEDEFETEDEVGEEEAVGGGSGRFAAGIALGALLGATVALLLAPAAGDVTRRRLRRKLEEVKDVAGDGLDDLRRRAKREIRKRVDSI